MLRVSTGGVGTYFLNTLHGALTSDFATFSAKSFIQCVLLPRGSLRARCRKCRSEWPESSFYHLRTEIQVCVRKAFCAYIE